MIDIKESIKEVDLYLKLLDLDKKLSASTTQMLVYPLYAEVRELESVLEARNILINMPKSAKRTKMMAGIEAYLSPLDPNIAEMTDSNNTDSEILAENIILKRESMHLKSSLDAANKRNADLVKQFMKT